MPSTLRFPPLQTSYSQEFDGGMIEIPLEGGFSRKRQDILTIGKIVNCQWLLTKAEYSEFMGFFTTDLRFASEDFLIDLIIDVGIPVTYTARTVGGMPKLIRQSGDGYWVTCTLQCDSDNAFTRFIAYTLDRSPSWKFDGVDDRVNIGNVLGKDITDAFSITGEFDSDSLTATQVGRIISKESDALNQRGWSLSGGDGSGFRLVFYIGNNFPTDCLVVRTTNQFQSGKFCVTYDGSATPLGVTVYINGSPVGRTTVINTLTGTTLSSADLVIGCRPNGLFPYHGNLKNIGVWNKELTFIEQQTISNSDDPVGAGITGLESLWRLDGTDSLTAGGVTDQVGSNDGTVANGLGSLGISVGTIVFPFIAEQFNIGDSLRIINSSGIHPNGSTPVNLDGIYDIIDIPNLDTIVIDDPQSINFDWTKVLLLGTYGNLGNGNVNSTIVKVPS